MAKALLQLIQLEFPDAVLETHSQHGDDTVVVDPGAWKAVARFCKDQLAMEMLADLTCVDWPHREPRFDVVAHLHSLSKGQRLRLKARVGDAEGEHAAIDSLTELWASANWAEREAWDMFGVVFTDHPDLRRILTYPEFVGHALRKDYPADRIQPLVPYREVENIEKLPPFDHHEGMSFGRQTHLASRGDD
ncbi:MAG: NADH-quinone oxidoreductase subunit C [Polyangiaceae bacterium]|nr:NADH-quinone oxidoreductase subunit C [Polyangiaceae bacterium]